jgi:hypothetical protein
MADVEPVYHKLSWLLVTAGSILPLFLAMRNGAVYFRCLGVDDKENKCGRFVPIKKVHYSKDKNRNIIRYCFCSGCKSKLDHHEGLSKLNVKSVVPIGDFNFLLFHWIKGKPGHDTFRDFVIVKKR